jgi:predicted Zn-ribbon and HTH transcriptional regulator
MDITCNKCNQQLSIDCFHLDCSKPQGRSRTCRDCTRLRYANRPRVSTAKTRTSKPCRHCKQHLDASHYKRLNSWYCIACTQSRKELARLSLPPVRCNTCGTLTERANLLKTRDRCIHCHSQLASQRKQAQYTQHEYSTSAQAVRKRRYRKDPFYRLKDNVITLIANAFANKNYSKHSRTHTILGCSYQDFCTHIQSQFTAGMSWDNRSLWHLDHRVPVSLAENEAELMLLNRWDNFQPLWSGHNSSKSASVDREDPIYLELLLLRSNR